MRILSLSLCLAAVACVSAQAAPEQPAAFDPMAPVDTQNNYAWAADSAGAEELVNQISELQLRSQILTSFNEYGSEFQAEVAACDVAIVGIKAALAAISTAVNIGSAIPILGSILGYVKTSLDDLTRLVDLATSNQNGAMLGGAVDLAYLTIRGTLSALGVGPLGAIIQPLLSVVDQAKAAVMSLVKCLTGGSKLAIESGHCNGLADVYRLVVSESLQQSPALPDSASADLKRIHEGSVAILDLLSKNSIAATNDALLTVRPIFAADVLEQYRDEYVRLAEADDLKNFAVANLGLVVGISNGLEACLRIAADPVAAEDELNEELEAQARYEDEDEDEDEDDEDEE